MQRLRDRQEWKFFSVLPLADGPLAVAWWAVLVLRGVLPALFAVTVGMLVGAVQRGESLAAALTLTGRRLYPPADSDADPHRHRGEPRGSNRRPSLRQAHRCVCAPARHGAFGESQAHHRPVRCARLRSRYVRPAPVVLHGLHCRRHDRDDRRPGMRRAAFGLCVVGPAAARRCLDRHALPAA